MGGAWYDARGIYGQFLFCETSGDGAWGIYHGKHTVWKAGNHSEADSGRCPFGAVEGGSEAYPGDDYGDGFGRFGIRGNSDIHPCRPVREEFQLCKRGWESVLPGKFDYEPNGAARYDDGACAWDDRTSEPDAGAFTVPDGGWQRCGSCRAAAEIKYAV